MDKDRLVATGLTPLQAEAYILLLEKGRVSPPQLAAALSLSRTNAYKLLDKLVELKLVVKSDDQKKLVYSPNNPLALASITAQFRTEALAREEAASNVMHDLLAHYYEHTDKPTVTSVTGRTEVAKLYRKQLSLREDICFVHTPADVPMMGFETMNEIRITPARHGNQRKGIISAAEQKKNPASHKRTNLEITWIDKNQYNAPVEWSVTKSSLLIVSYGLEPHAILLVDPLIAGAFLQLWNLLNSLLNN